MDRLFYSNGRAGEPKRARVQARGPRWRAPGRAGTTSAFDDINKFFTIAQMPVVSSRYWNNVHGNAAEETEGGTPRASGPCASSGATWRGCSSAWRPGARRAWSCPRRRAGETTNFIR